MKYVMVSSISDGRKSGAISVAGEIAQLGILNGFDKLGKNIDRIISYCPNRVYPNGPLIYKGGLKNMSGRKINFLPYINLPVIRWITLNIALIFSLIGFASRGDAVIFYNYSYPSGWAGLISRAIKRFNLFAIIFDIHVPGETVKNNLKWRFEYFTYKYILPRTDKLIVISDEIIKNFSPAVPSLLIEGGIHEINEVKFNHVVKKETNGEKLFKIGFAGRLDDDNCILEILQAFKKIEKSGAPVELNIAGNGKYTEEVKKAAAESARIIFHGQVAHSKSVEILKKQNLNLCIRATKKFHTRYFFPSKLLEYMFLGVPVLATDIPFSKGNINKYTFVLKGEESEDIYKTILDVLNTNDIEIQAKLLECEKIKHSFMWDNQVKKMYKFFEGIDSDS
jgi:glycosyltransferase involved in cell wall biosynthesis